MKKNILLVLFNIISFSAFDQELVSPALVKWYTLEQAVKLSETNPRPILLSVYTEWCSWCKFMMKTTYANKGIADYINNNFYPARFDAETFDTIVFNGQKYFNRRIGSRPSHDLASILLDGKLSYPTIVFFDREKNKTIIPGYKETKDIEPILVYFAENVNKSATLDDFYLNFMFSFPKAYTDDHSIFKIDQKFKPDTLGKMNWIEPENIAQLQKKSSKQVLMFFYTDWSISSKVMNRTTFRDKELTDKLNASYYCIQINAASNDTINFLGKSFMGTGAGQPNQLSFAYLNNNFMMPAVVFLDQKNAVKGMINGFWAKKHFFPLLEYFKSDSNKKMTFQDYLKTYPTY